MSVHSDLVFNLVVLHRMLLQLHHIHRLINAANVFEYLLAVIFRLLFLRIVILFQGLIQWLLLFNNELLLKLGFFAIKLSGLLLPIYTHLLHALLHLLPPDGCLHLSTSFLLLLGSYHHGLLLFFQQLNLEFFVLVAQSSQLVLLLKSFEVLFMLSKFKHTVLALQVYDGSNARAHGHAAAITGVNH